MNTIIPEKWYDILAWINRVFLPAFIVLVGTILACCGVNGAAVAIVTGILGAIEVFLGKILQDDKKKYMDAQKEEASNE